MQEDNPWMALREEFACEHEETLFRVMTCTDGRKAWVRQCQRCGANRGFVRKEMVPVRQRLEASPFDGGLRQRWQSQYESRRNEIAERLAAERGARNSLWWRRYNAYLETEGWAAKRRAVLKRDNYVCQGCRTNQATQIHHLTYERVEKEMLFDLVAICDECHRMIHEDLMREEELE